MHGGYLQFCPVAMSAELLSRRWTIIIMRELIAGSTRFNELRRGVPRMSSGLLSQRLKELEAAGIVTRDRGSPGRGAEYRLTAAGRDLKELVEAYGRWGQRWVEADLALQNLDVGLLMWDMRRNLMPDRMPGGRKIIQFVYPELRSRERSWWLVVDPAEEVDLCSVDMGFDVDLFVTVDLRTMTAIWMGRDTVQAAVNSGRMVLTGDQKLAAAMQTWLGLSPFARGEKLAS